MTPVQLSPQAQATLAVMNTELKRNWTPGAVSVRLDCSPALARGRLQALVRHGLVRRVCVGEYRLVLPDDPVPEPLPSSPPPVIRVTSLMREQLLGELRRYGQPLHASTLAGRLRRSGFDLPTVNAVVGVLLRAGKVRREGDGKVVLM